MGQNSFFYDKLFFLEQIVFFENFVFFHIPIIFYLMQVQIGRITNIVVVTKIITTAADEVETFNPTFVIMK